MSQTIRYIKFIHGQYPPEKIVYLRADDVNIFTTDTPPIPPGESPVDPSVGRWSKVTVHHKSPVDVLIAEERRVYGDTLPVEVITDYNFE